MKSRCLDAIISVYDKIDIKHRENTFEVRKNYRYNYLNERKKGLLYLIFFQFTKKKTRFLD